MSDDNENENYDLFSGVTNISKVIIIFVIIFVVVVCVCLFVYFFNKITTNIINESNLNLQPPSLKANFNNLNPFMNNKVIKYSLFNQ